jgi:hypothetical protein
MRRMNNAMQTKMRTFALMTAAVAMTVVAGCELIVDFDRTKIADGSDATTDGTAPPPDSGNDTGTTNDATSDADTTEDAGTDANDSGATDASDSGNGDDGGGDADAG